MVSDLEVCSLLERPILGIVGGRGILEALGKIPDKTVCFWPLHSNHQIRQLIFITQELKDAVLWIVPNGGGLSVPQVLINLGEPQDAACEAH